MPKTALVTGGGTGIGRGISLALARRGVSVALVGRRREPLEAVAQEIARLGAKGIALPADLAEASHRAGILEQARSSLGALDILVNNAGVRGGGKVASMSPEEVEREVAVNLVAPVELTRQALPGLAARRGKVVLVASSVSQVPLPYMPLYSATKAGLRAFAESLRYEVEPLGVHLLLVYPPRTRTAMTRASARTSGLPRWLLADPNEVGERIVRALWSNRKELQMSQADRTLHLIYRLAPWLLRTMLATQSKRFEKMTRDA